MAAACAIVGGALAQNLTPKTYAASIQVRVLLNLGGNRINSSADAAVESVVFAERSTLHVARLELRGAALADAGALNRVRCGRDRADTTVTCSTTSGNKSAAIAILNQLIAAAIPVSVLNQTRTFQDTAGEMMDQYRANGTADAQLRRTIARLGAIRHPSTTQRNTLIIDRTQLNIKQSVRRDILSRVASIRRQISAVGRTLRVLDHGAQVTGTSSGALSLLLGATAGLVLGVLLAAGGLVALSGPRRAQARVSASGRPRSRADASARHVASSD